MNQYNVAIGFEQGSANVSAPAYTTIGNGFFESFSSDDLPDATERLNELQAELSSVTSEYNRKKAQYNNCKSAVAGRRTCQNRYGIKKKNLEREVQNLKAEKKALQGEVNAQLKLVREIQGDLDWQREQALLEEAKKREQIRTEEEKRLAEESVKQQMEITGRESTLTDRENAKTQNEKMLKYGAIGVGAISLIFIGIKLFK